MRTDDLTNETDGLFKKGFGEMPEEAPSAEQWQQMKGRMADEGLISGKSKRRGLIILFSLLIVGSLSTALYYFNNTSPTPHKEISNITNTEKTAPNTTASPRSSTTENEKTEKEITKNNVHENNSSVTANQPAEKIASENQAASIVPDKKVTTARNGNQSASGGLNTVASTVHRSQPSVASSDLPTEKAPAVVVTKDSYGENKVEKASAGTTDGEQASNKTIGDKSESAPVLDNHSDQPTAVASVETESKKSTTDANGSKDEKAVVKKDSAVANPQSAAVPSTDTSDYKKPAVKAKRFHIGGYFSVDFTNYLVKKNSSVPQSDANYVSQSSAINGVQSTNQFTTGVTGGYMISDRVEVETGLFYSQKKKVDDNLVTPVNTQNSTGQSYSDFIYYYNAQYLEVNGKVKYYIPTNDASKKFYVGLGAVASFNYPGKSGDLGYFSRKLYNDSTWVQYDKVILEPSSASISALVSAGFETTFSDRWGLFVEPSYKYALNPVIKQPDFDYIPVNHFWRTVSIGLGLRYGF